MSGDNRGHDPIGTRRSAADAIEATLDASAQSVMAPGAPPAIATPSLTRTMGFTDLVLFYVITGFSLRWIAQAAAAGPSAVVVWIIACLTFYVPHVFCVLELSARYPEEGGAYVWAKRAFGGYAGFITAWTYWCSNLPYFPALLYFGAASAVIIGGPHWQHLSTDPTYYLAFSLVGIGIAAWCNIVGLNIGKWLHNVAAVGLWIPTLILIGVGVFWRIRLGPVNSFTWSTMVPSTHLRDLIFWSTVAFSLSGLESASMLGDEIVEPRKNIPRALLVAGILITGLYMASTVAVLFVLPAAQVSTLDGVIRAIVAGSQAFGLGALALVAAVLITVSVVGGTGAWFAAAGRLPFVAGLDRYLPASFAKLHPKWKTPHIALLAQGVLAVLFIFLGQAGTSVKGAYDVLVGMSIIAYFIPYLFMFAALIVLQKEPAGPEVSRVPGGRPVAVAMGALGFLTTAASMFLACVPSPDDPSPTLAVAKVVGSSVALVLIGTAVYGVAKVRMARPAAVPDTVAQ